MSTANKKDIHSVSEEIRLNVRRGLKQLECNRDTKPTEITKQLHDLAVEDMTSADLSVDIRSDYRTFEWRLRDIIYTKKLFKAICCNEHLFKDKVKPFKNHPCDLSEIIDL